MATRDEITARVAAASTNGYHDDIADDPDYIRSVVDDAARRNSQPETSFRSRMLSLQQLANIPKPDPLIHGLIDLDSMVLVYGKRGCGKSFLAVDWIASIATGNRWFNRPVTHSKVVYVVGEGASGLYQRYEAWSIAHPMSALPTEEQLLVLPEAVNLLSPSSVGKFADEMADYGAHLIVFDTLSRCMVGGDENSARDAGIAVESLDTIRRHTGACIWPVHHAGKLSTAGARGSSAFEAAADSVFEMTVADGVVILACTKQKNHPESSPIKMRLINTGESVVLEQYRGGDDGVSESLLDTLRSLASIELPEGITNTQWRDQMVSDTSKTEPTFNRHLKELRDIGLVSNVSQTKTPRYVVSDAGAIALSPDSHDVF